MENMSELFGGVIDQALNEARERGVLIYTFALYYDHESPSISVCIDTEERSKITVGGINSYNRKHFIPAVANGDLKGAALWMANIGRSLSLGDFHMVNAARIELIGGFLPTDEFFLGMARALIAAEADIVAQAKDAESLLLCCSGKSEEVELWWTVA